jgi:hypothetical protein
VENGAVGSGDTTRLQFTAPGDEGVTIRICIDRGAIVVYGSYLHSNPSPAYYDFRAILDAGGEVMADSCYVSHVTSEVTGNSDRTRCMNTKRRKKRQSEEEMVTIYIAIEGLSDGENQFLINSSLGEAFGK